MGCSKNLVILVVKALLMMMATMCLIGCDIQYKYLYYPNGAVPSDSSLAGLNMKLWPCAGDNYRGLVSTRKINEPKGTVIVFHGNGGTAADRTYYDKWLGPLGYRVLLAEYPMYGGRSGKLGEAGFVSDAGETVRLADEDFEGPVFLLGESLGCGVVAAVAKQIPDKTDGVILVTPWDTLFEIAKSYYPRFLVKLLLKDRYDSIRNLEKYSGPIAVIGAERDEVLPVRHAIHLYETLPGEKRMWIIQNAGHNDWQMVANAQWWNDVMGFITSPRKED